MDQSGASPALSINIGLKKVFMPDDEDDLLGVK